MGNSNKSSTGHVHSHPYPDKGISGSDAGGPVSGKHHQGKVVSGGKQSSMTTCPPAFKK
jgi:hypothetical protein